MLRVEVLPARAMPFEALPVVAVVAERVPAFNGMGGGRVSTDGGGLRRGWRA